MIAAPAPDSGPIPVIAVPAPSAKPASHKTYRFYRIRRGDTLGSVAKRFYGHRDRWQALWWVNRGKIKNPDFIRVGIRIRLTRWHPAREWLARKAQAHEAPAYVPRHVAPATTVTASQPVLPAGTTTVAPNGSFQQCVIERESGGDPNVMNSSGHYGLYQFSAATWAAYGGNPADFGNASAAEQNQVFANAMAQGGESNWAPYDGC